MNRLKIDFEKVNPFVFEKYQKRKIAEVTKAEASNEKFKSPVDLTPQAEIRSKVQQVQKELEEEQAHAGDAESQSPFLAQSTQSKQQKLFSSYDGESEKGDVCQMLDEDFLRLAQGAHREFFSSTC